ncbi:hypothetical protein ABVK25_003020 [Lepraria finkii]|uniref:Uncharacterized protein n=1 Tax=Lepraria finkii TaxID=1340010 RepID=A0ABR4BIG9_9LECA
MEFETQITALKRVAGRVEWRAFLVKLIQQDLLAEHRHLLQNVEERGFLLEELFANAERASLVLERNEDMMRIAKIIEDNVYLKAEITLGLRRRRGRKDSGNPQPSSATNAIMQHYDPPALIPPPAEEKQSLPKHFLENLNTLIPKSRARTTFSSFYTILALLTLFISASALCIGRAVTHNNPTIILPANSPRRRVLRQSVLSALNDILCVL